MSTTFGVFLGEGRVFLDEDEQLTEDNYFEDFEPVAFQGNGTGIRWTNPLAPKLHPETRLYALDNTPQGIYTVGDVIREIEKQEKGA